MADNNGEKTYTQEQVDQEVQGLKEKNQELIGKVKEAQKQLDAWKDLDPSEKAAHDWPAEDCH